jgi:hypothetical protein
LQKNLRFVSVIVRPGRQPAVLATVQAWAWAVSTVTGPPPDGASAAEAVRMAVRSRRRLRGGMVLDEPGGESGRRLAGADDALSAHPRRISVAEQVKHPVCKKWLSIPALTDP